MSATVNLSFIFKPKVGYMERQHTRGQFNNPRAKSLTDRYSATPWEGHSEILFSLAVPLWAAERLTRLIGNFHSFSKSLRPNVWNSGPILDLGYFLL
jgi:hypothetical protein